ncbi:MAG: 4-hydroxythreonine-4-phosphate dehydrogenase PdxA [Spirochaetaceae bacterium]|nr:4-hydroxythreonine-4-phosphate dehydrogenase PdxA [Spirochaetaceae bacterium]MCF7947593.1 4-hydroxythreonine-4-phosphate dehydrogenase PdxA [Spirochaetia bacterium]MCF7951461.1 4-hydroxythreonine-4-phosphate dehydrogenase PdxA [Spirochaetaceae bacterium]
MRPRIQLLLGDTAGVGPELCVKVMNDLPKEAQGVQIVLTGDGRVLQEAMEAVGESLELPTIKEFAELAGKSDPVVFWDYRTEDTAVIPRAAVSEAAGREVLNSLMQSIDLARREEIDGVVFAPFNKESMHLAGAKHYSELELFKEEFDRQDIPGEFNILDGLWIARVTSHIPVAQIAGSLNEALISKTISLLGEAQVVAGIQPRIAVASLNPHSGEHGIFGDEEGRLITPAVEMIKEKYKDWKIEGPIPADTLFPRVLKGGYTGVVGMYHDQIQIATKLIGLERGVTLHPGMKVPIATAAHGTAFDLKGSGKAGHNALKNAVALVADMALGAQEV